MLVLVVCEVRKLAGYSLADAEPSTPASNAGKSSGAAQQGASEVVSLECAPKLRAMLTSDMVWLALDTKGGFGPL